MGTLCACSMLECCSVLWKVLSHAVVERHRPELRLSCRGRRSERAWARTAYHKRGEVEDEVANGSLDNSFSGDSLWAERITHAYSYCR